MTDAAPISVLLVEDNPGDARLVTEHLQVNDGARFAVRHVVRLADAIEDLGNHETDIVLLDLTLPDSRGLDTLEQLRDCWPRVPVVVLTGLDDDDVGMRSLQRGAQDYLVKDEVDERRVTRALRYAIERSRGVRDIEQWQERYALWIQQSSDGLWDWDLRTNRITYSSGWAEFLGYQHSQIGDVPDEWFDRVHARDAERLANTLDVHFASDDPTFSVDYRMYDAAGRVRWMRGRGVIVRDAEGKAFRVAGSQNDVTETLDNPCLDCGSDNLRAAALCAACGGKLDNALPSSESRTRLRGGELPPGTVLADHYEIGDLIDVGASGAVYAGTDLRKGLAVAIKVLHTWLVDSGDATRRFVDEGRIQLGLRHPNIVAVHNVLAVDGVAVIVMEYVAGPTLRDYMMSADAPADPHALTRLFLPAIRGIGYAHSQGVVHRDIKPENTLLAQTDDGLVPKLTDFGIAKVLAARKKTRTGAMMGTLQYMAPEQFVDAADVDGRSDIYSLACTLYELLTRRPPFDYESEFRMLAAHMTEQPSSPRAYNPLVSRDLGLAVLRALSKEPEDRYPDCASFISALNHAMSSGPTL